jgi:hypothetical protein
MKSKQKLIWDIVSEILSTHGDMVDSIHIIEYKDAYDNENRKIYHSDGYCFELSKEEADVNGFCDVEDSFVYIFFEPWDGFKEAGIDKAIEILNEYASLNIKS